MGEGERCRGLVRKQSQHLGQEPCAIQRRDSWTNATIPRPGMNGGKRLTVAWHLNAVTSYLHSMAGSSAAVLRLITGRESTFNPFVRLSEEVSVFMFP